MTALLVRLVICAWSHRPFRTQTGEGDWVHLSCSKCRETWMEPRW